MAGSLFRIRRIAVGTCLGSAARCSGKSYGESAYEDCDQAGHAKFLIHNYVVF